MEHLGQVISPVSRPLLTHRTTQKAEEKRQIFMLGVGFEPKFVVLSVIRYIVPLNVRPVSGDVNIRIHTTKQLARCSSISG
jgi:hypothetical protein